MKRTDHSATRVAVLLAGDFACIAAAYLLACYLQGGEAGAFSELAWSRLVYLAGFLVCWPVAALYCFLFISRRRDNVITLLFDISRATLATLVVTGFFVAYYTPRGADPALLSSFGLGVLANLFVFRILVQLLLWSLRSHGRNERMMLIVGVNERTQELVRVIRNHPHYGYRIAGVLEEDPDRTRMLEEFNIAYLGNFDSLEEVLIKQVIDEVYICLPVRSRYETIQKMAHLCEGVGVGVRMIADLFPLRLATSRYHRMEGIPILALSTVPEHQPQIIAQRLVDIAISLSALLALSPVLIATALAIKFDSKGPVFFLQERVGLNRRRFRMIKFRSMVVNAEELRARLEAQNEVQGAMFKMQRDPRVTGVGRFIRKYSIDELPQLINVLRGDMSLVGPRPALPQEVSQYSWNQRRRLSVKPGLTGLSQVSGRSELSFRETVDLDLYYIDQWSILLVFKIILKTVPAVLKGRGAY
ncbi:MAG: exopolysaccharide biosynthesis polyprenyl glycosylphosphotransferase [Candidatus Hydrogenedens sp.]|nr:exopolysaccharide biosynthesis polyprenyl glycosylphosphotransferase [Candidatus Hydrogenedens sp.]